MRDLMFFFINPLGGKEVSLDSKKKFGEDALIRFASQNGGGQFTTELNEMEAAQTGLFGTITSVQTTKAISEARTKTTNGIMEKFSKRTSKLNQFLVLNDVDKQDVYQEFFPQGVMEFTTHLTKENVAQRMEFIIKAITDNLAVAGGATVLADFVDIQKKYTDARGLQLGKISETATGRDLRNTAEEAWDDAMFDGLLAAAKAHRNHPEKLSLFFNQSILRTPVSAASDGKGRVTGVVTRGGHPVPAIRVHVVDGNINDATTDDAGGYTTQSLPIGPHTVLYFENDVQVHSQPIKVVDDGDTTLDVVLG